MQDLPALDDIVTLLLIIVAIALTALLLYLSTRLITGRKDTDTPYIIRLVVVAVLIFVIVFGVQAVVGALGDIGELSGLAGAVVVIIFTAIIYIVKILVLPATTGRFDVWERAIWIALLTTIFIYAFNAITDLLFSTPIIPIF